MASKSTVPPFSSHLVLEDKIAEPALRAYYVGFDQQRFRLKALGQVIADVIPEFALGYYHGLSVPINEVASRLREAAHRIYSTDKYKSRGEFGELILHLLLRDHCGSIPLVSKIFFKDAVNVPVHGFDGVHIVINGTEKQLWLGESKLYENGPAGITDLLKDLKSHFTEDYLRKEFALIGSKLPSAIPEIEEWRELLHAHQRLDIILDRVCIPMVCTYSSDVFSKHADNTKECLADFLQECKALNESFVSRKVATKLDVILMLLPVQSKSALVDEIHARLLSMQGI